MPLRIVRGAGRVALLALLVGLFGATLVRLGPGFDVDEGEMDTRLRQESRDELRMRRAGSNNIGLYYLHYLRGAVQGDFGVSQSLNRPVSQLIAQRLPVTLASLAYGVLGGTALGFLLATANLIWRAPAFSLASSAFVGLSLSIPSAVIALLFLWAGANGRWAIALVIFPYVYRYTKNLLVQAFAAPHVITALAKGLSFGRVFLAHVIAPVAPQLAAVAGISVSIAFGASIPIEVICDSPGVGQLAWQAALGRDMPLLVGITILVALMTMTVNGLADLFLEERRP